MCKCWYGLKDDRCEVRKVLADGPTGLKRLKTQERTGYQLLTCPLITVLNMAPSVDNRQNESSSRGHIKYVIIGHSDELGIFPRPTTEIQLGGA